MLYALKYYGHNVVEQHHAIDKDGARYIGLLSLESADGQYQDTVGLRNSHDRKCPVGIAYGSRVFVCSNLAFVSDIVVTRKHTQRARRDLPGLVAEIIEPLYLAREAQQKTFASYKATLVSDRLADHAIMSMYREGVINVQRIAEVHEQWQNPAHDWGDSTAWRLFNAATYALNGRVAENPGVTSTLHKIIDGVCEVVH